MLIWHYGKDGQFMVKSAYYLELTRRWTNAASTLGLGEGRYSQEHQDKWDIGWQSRTPPKVRMFIWKTCQEAISTQSDLATRIGVSGGVCAFCGVEEETTMHVLLQCSFARQAWALTLLPWRILSTAATSTKEWIWLTYGSLGA
ncbi:hypothetical protein Sango_1873300 [Sesamum angolense]|uniref:Reverse transcriptase zinc-binding domain-containing protein n=1 Tax=Sesamum angolense TaxID=2727404 RepID=A0AAE2BQR6_9LAMI|nr:hypothetical protein Sango_1873300 [Sesamum angolense]